MSIYDLSLREMPQNYYRNGCSLLALNNGSLALSSILGKFANFQEHLARAFSNPMEYVVSMMIYPFDVTNFFKNYTTGVSKVDIGGVLCTIASPYDDAYLLRTPYSFIKIGDNLTFTRKYNDARDFSPYTKIKLWLPYYNFVDLEPSEVYDITIEVYYSIDFYTGSMHITLWDKTNNRVYNQYDGKIGFHLPVSQNNLSDRIRNGMNASISAIASALAIGVGVATGGVAGGTAIASGVGLLGSTATQMANASTKHVNVNGFGDSGTTMISPSYLFIMYDRVKIAKDFDMNKYAHLHGRPLMNTRTLSTLQGYTRVGANDLKGFASATDEEKSMLKEKLTSGIIL